MCRASAKNKHRSASSPARQARRHVPTTASASTADRPTTAGARCRRSRTRRAASPACRASAKDELVGEERAARMAGVEQARGHDARRRPRPGGPTPCATPIACSSVERDLRAPVKTPVLPFDQRGDQRERDRTERETHRSTRRKRADARADERARRVTEHAGTRPGRARVPLPDRLQAGVDHRRAIRGRSTRGSDRQRQRTRAARRCPHVERQHRDEHRGDGSEREREHRLARQPRRAKARGRTPGVAGIGEVQRRRAQAGDDECETDRARPASMRGRARKNSRGSRRRNVGERDERQRAEARARQHGEDERARIHRGAHAPLRSRRDQPGRARDASRARSGARARRECRRRAATGSVATAAARAAAGSG